MAIGYQNKIFSNGLMATVPGDHAVTAAHPEAGSTSVANGALASENVDSKGMNGTNETVNSSTDDEESIDQNMIVEQYQNEINGKVR